MLRTGWVSVDGMFGRTCETCAARASSAGSVAGSARVDAGRTRPGRSMNTLALNRVRDAAVPAQTRLESACDQSFRTAVHPGRGRTIRSRATARVEPGGIRCRQLSPYARRVSGRVDRIWRVRLVPGGTATRATRICWVTSRARTFSRWAAGAHPCARWLGTPGGARHRPRHLDGHVAARRRRDDRGRVDGSAGAGQCRVPTVRRRAVRHRVLGPSVRFRSSRTPPT